MKPIPGFSGRSALRAILISGVLMLILVGVALAAAPFLVDHFITGFQDVSCLAPCTASSTVAAAGVPGGTRDVSIQAGGTSGRSPHVLVDPVNATTLSFIQATGEAVTALIDWDGNGNPAVFNPVGLNNLDLTQGNTNTGLHIRVVFDDMPIDVTFRIYTDGSNWSETTFNLPGGIAVPRSFFVPFSSFTAGTGGGRRLAM
jgi:hypothetical protein